LGENSNLENLTLTGTSAIDGIGNSLNNVITGNSGTNSLTGLAGNDILNGGAGIDTLIGGDGNDTYIVDSTTDTITETATGGTDTIQSYVSYTLAENLNLENLTLTGTSAINGTGNSLNNILTGNAANNTLDGGAGNDTLIGGLGNDTLVGGLGNDTLTGGAGLDSFTFNAPNQGVDTITDFVVVDDAIVVSAIGFGGNLIAGAAITAEQFVLGTAATDASDRFIYNSINGALFFDVDGTGSIAGVQIATLSTKPSITNADIVVMA
jgi:Ca2+-binding RTX toxin-like protein